MNRLAMSNPRFNVRLGVKEIRSCARYLLTSGATIYPKTKLGIKVMRDTALAVLSIRRNSALRQKAEAKTRYIDIAGDEDYPRKQADMELICKLRNVASLPVGESRWAILFDDPEVQREVFVGNGAEEAAKKRFAQCLNNWTCYLFKEVGLGESREPLPMQDNHMQSDLKSVDNLPSVPAEIESFLAELIETWEEDLAASRKELLEIKEIAGMDCYGFGYEEGLIAAMSRALEMFNKIAAKEVTRTQEKP